MPEEQWLIDGYNLLHDLSRARSKQKSSRESLFTAVANFASVRHCRVLFVLDGKGDGKEFAAFETAHFHIVYSQSVSADAYIEKYLYEHRTRCAIVVVTKDRAIVNAARGGGSRVLAPSEFRELLADGRKDSADALFKEKVRSHGFHRPFDGKI